MAQCASSLNRREPQYLGTRGSAVRLALDVGTECIVMSQAVGTTLSLSDLSGEYQPLLSGASHFDAALGLSVCQVFQVD